METNLKTFGELAKGKRLINAKECECVLPDVFERLQKCFDRALQYYFTEVRLTPVKSRGKGYEATVMNSKIIQSIQEEFPNDWYFGKYKRFFLRMKGFIFLFKKLNAKDMPMNMSTNLMNRIENQMEGNLFGKYDNGNDPILFFGYKKLKMGLSYISKLVYIDEGVVKWRLFSNQHLGLSNDIAIASVIDQPKITLEVKRGNRNNAINE